ncbi:MAG TPA: GNAT family N-acetyltransferase [Gammaproteobacteria bacterium]|nr:GNAT family N-acetyltransferase [Gammaproteobacteria bacterium]
MEQLSSLTAIGAPAWNALVGDDPFLAHEFLTALERSGCVGPGTTWVPAYLTACDEHGLAGALPLYIKYDSRGEFVFDWSWADAYERAGRSYYPKLVAAVPFTPATGARLLLRKDTQPAVARELLRAARETAVALGASSLHVLFPTEQETQLLDAEGFLARKSCQFHWHNADYADFDDFLGRFSSAKRKKAKRERRRIAEAGITFEHLRGDEPSAADWDTIFDCYSRTFELHGRPPYLNRELFAEIAQTMPERLVIVLARHRGTPIATAICFRSRDTLYGRYWGSVADFHSLHFETCYYQGIEYCIRHGLQKFEPGTQGEHKISRGFTPQATWSYHWLRDRDFHAAVAQFLRRETRHVDAYMTELDEHVPYREAPPQESPLVIPEP